jgi:L-threonylcarbamoyladenylate synthase
MIVSPEPAQIAQAAALLAAGGIIGLPTETVYGLAADASNAAAVARIYAAKGRPSDHPLIVHLAPTANIGFWAAAVPNYAFDLMKAFWPGPLTLVLPRTVKAGDFITGRQDTVALRCPAHPVAQALLQACLDQGIQGLAAPSANRFGRVSPTTAQHVDDEFAGAVFTLDGGACEVGIESTIVDCTQAAARILRHGAVSLADVARVMGSAGVVALDGVSQHATPRVSGSLAAHYAPSTPLRFCSVQDASQLVPTAVFMGFQSPPPAPTGRAAFHAMPQDAARYAQQLYATLRNLDAMGYSAIAVQPLPAEPQWAGVADRLSRAAATFA